ncbi:uncharacterized protein [Drosophila suzukii]|uniref:Uncharacterized protein isoform X2 n=1 Tax=Drosophila suzukii TaxID=28584 RepID=A0AB40AA98_DROSZ
MNRPKQGTSSNNSGTSSETSETQSVDDQQSAPQSNIRAGSSASLSRAKNSWRRMKELAAEKEKENEAKRPPWRAVSVSTLTKPDKSALLRAKLLDASRRLRAGKANVALQTDFVPTKLMKEASFGVQNDLILYKDIGILTDGQYSKKKDGYEKLCLPFRAKLKRYCPRPLTRIWSTRISPKPMRMAVTLSPMWKRGWAIRLPR